LIEGLQARILLEEFCNVFVPSRSSFFCHRVYLILKESIFLTVS